MTISSMPSFVVYHRGFDRALMVEDITGCRLVPTIGSAVLAYHTQMCCAGAAKDLTEELALSPGTLVAARLVEHKGTVICKICEEIKP